MWDAGKSQIRGGYGKRKLFEMFACHLLARESASGKGGAYVEEYYGYLSWWVDGWEDGFAGLNMLLFMLLASLVSRSLR